MPLIITSLLCVQILSAAREPVVGGWDIPVWIFAIDAIFITISVGLVLWVRSGSIPGSLNNPVAAFGVFLAGLKPITFMLATEDSEPFYMAMIMLAGSLCFLSIRYLVLSIILITAAYLSVAIRVLPVAATVSALVIMLLGAALSVLVLHRRILGAIALLTLEERVVTLESILPMCASCKKTRDHTGKWQSVEEYIEEQHAGTQVSHGSCPSCTEELYGDLLRKREAG